MTHTRTHTHSHSHRHTNRQSRLFDCCWCCVSSAFDTRQTPTTDACSEQHQQEQQHRQKSRELRELVSNTRQSTNAPDRVEHRRRRSSLSPVRSASERESPKRHAVDNGRELVHVPAATTASATAAATIVSPKSSALIYTTDCRFRALSRSLSPTRYASRRPLDRRRDFLRSNTSALLQQQQQLRHGFVRSSPTLRPASTTTTTAALTCDIIRTARWRSIRRLDDVGAR